MATFAGCQIVGKAGTYTLSASATGLSAATTNSFNLTVGPATQLAFSTQPNGGANGATWTTQPAVSVEDSGGNVVTTNNTASVTLAIATQPGGGGTLACTTNPKTAADGVATFAGCKITGKAGSYTLSASGTGLTTATTNPFNLTAGPASQLAFSTQPGGGANGATWTTQPVVTIEDASGNVTSAGSITLAIATQPGSGATSAARWPPGRQPAWPPSPAARSSVRPAATPSAPPAPDSAPPTPSPSPSARPPSWRSPPSPTAGPTVWPGPPSRWSPSRTAVATRSPATSPVTLAIATQPGSGATLTCTTNPVTAVSGVATFAGCQIVGKAGSYTLSATTAGLTSATTNAFTITFGAATQLAVTTQPNGGVNGATWTTQPVVTVEDVGGNTVTSSSASVTLAIATQPGSGATLA